MKRVFSMLCALALVLPMLCTGAVAAELEEQQLEQYVFEKMPDIMLFDDFNFVLTEDRFVIDLMIPSGFYDFVFTDFRAGISLETLYPFEISFVPLEDPDFEGGDFYISYFDLCVSAPLDGSPFLIHDCFIVKGSFESDEISFFCFPESLTMDFSEGSQVVFTSVEDLNATPGGMPAVLGQMDTTVPSIFSTVYDMIRSNSLLAFLAFCGILAAAAALYSSLKAVAK